MLNDLSRVVFRTGNGERLYSMCGAARNTDAEANHGDSPPPALPAAFEIPASVASSRRAGGRDRPVRDPTRFVRLLKSAPSSPAHPCTRAHIRIEPQRL